MSPQNLKFLYGFPISSKLYALDVGQTDGRTDSRILCNALCGLLGDWEDQPGKMYNYRPRDSLCRPIRSDDIAIAISLVRLRLLWMWTIN